MGLWGLTMLILVHTGLYNFFLNQAHTGFISGFMLPVTSWLEQNWPIYQHSSSRGIQKNHKETLENIWNSNINIVLLLQFTALNKISFKCSNFFHLVHYNLTISHRSFEGGCNVLSCTKGTELVCKHFLIRKCCTNIFTFGKNSFSVFWKYKKNTACKFNFRDFPPVTFTNASHNCHMCGTIRVFL